MPGTSLIPGLLNVQVKKSIIPTSNINGLYLNLVGTSWGNTTQQDQDYYDLIPGILQSSKVLASTSELIAPEKVPVVSVSVSSQGDLLGPDAQSWILTKS